MSYKLKSLSLAFVLLPVVCWGIDTVRLKNGTLVRGQIQTETDAAITIEVAMAGGTIMKTETIKRADIAEIIYGSPELKAQQALEEEYRQTKKYTLNPNRSFALEHYDRVIHDVLRRYLALDSNSVHAAEVEQKLAQWQAERAQVAGGKMKYRGQWLPAEDAAVLLRQDAANERLAKAQALADRGNFEEAFALAGRQDSMEARRLQAAICQRWLASLEDKLRSFDREIELGERRLERALQSRDTAQRNLESYMRTHHSGELGYGALRAQYEGVVQRAEEELKKSEGHLAGIRDTQAGIARRITEVQTRAASIGSYAAPLPAPTAAAAAMTIESPAPVEEVTPLTGVKEWLAQYWFYLAGAGLIGLWLLSRLFR